MRVLMVEDDLTIAAFVTAGLQQAGFAVDHAPDGEAGLHLALTEPYDVAIVDLMLPQRDGLSLIEELRRHRRHTPVLILSAKHTVDDRVKGLQTGGDDYLTKPFAFAELLARVQALIRRASGLTAPTRLTVGDTGIGIPPEDLPYIWDRLYRGDKSRSQRGLGLGLSLVKAIVQAHRGSVAASSPRGDGARFALMLPIQPQV